MSGEKPEGEVVLVNLGVEAFGFWSQDAEGKRRFTWWDRPRSEVRSEYNRRGRLARPHRRRSS
jgi:hypothetical protein